MALIFTDSFDTVSDDEAKKQFESAPAREQSSGLVICKPEHQQYFNLIGGEFVDDLTDTEN
jgi:hypothetical protein